MRALLIDPDKKTVSEIEHRVIARASGRYSGARIIVRAGSSLARSRCGGPCCALNC
jgi:hypothetical protein